MFGYSLETIYLTTLIIIGCITILYLFFGDVADFSSDGIPILDPAIWLSFISFTSASGYILEHFTQLNSIPIFALCVLISIIFTSLIYFFVLIPIRSAEVSLTYTDESLEGQIAKVITPIPVDGFGEIIIETVNGIISKRAASIHNVEIPYEASVIIIEFREGTAFVTKYEK